MSDYTLSFDEVRDRFAEGYSRRFVAEAEAFARFDRWLAAHDREVAERAWRGGYYTGKHDYAGSLLGGQSISTPNPYRADAIEAGTDA